MDRFEYQNTLLARTAAAIHTHGLMIVSVGTGQCSAPGCRCGASRRPWAYSIGLCQADHPELITIGMGDCHSGPIINWVAGQHRIGNTLPIGREHDLDFRGVPIRLVPVPAASVDRRQGVLNQWFAYYDTFGPCPPPDVVQIVCADARGRFPWHADYDRASRHGQPVLQDDPTALRSQVSPIWPTRRTNAGGRRRR